MSINYKILIDAGCIKYPNGLWYYVEDLIKDLNKYNYQVYLICPKFMFNSDLKFIAISNFKGFIFSWYNMFNHVIIPTLCIRFYRRQSFVFHDDWPLLQENLLKRYIARLVFLIYKTSCYVFAISYSIKRKYKLKHYLPNKIDLNSEFSSVNKIECDYLIIGTETKRKRIDVILFNLDKFSKIKKNNACVCIVGDSNISLKEYSYLEIKIINSIEIHRIKPRSCTSLYISFSINEGFNRGAILALKKGFNIVLSDIDVHKEFFSDIASFFEKEQLVWDEKKFDLINYSNKNEIELFLNKISYRHNNIRQNVFRAFFK